MERADVRPGTDAYLVSLGAPIAGVRRRAQSADVWPRKGDVLGAGLSATK